MSVRVLGMNGEDHFDARAEELERAVRRALIAAFTRAEEAIDIDALADAIASENDEALARILHLDEGLQTDIDQILRGDFFDILLGGIVGAMVMFATRHGSRVNAVAESVRLRTEIRTNAIEPLARRSFEAALMTIATMPRSAFTPREVAEAVRQSIRLSPDQARSAAIFATALRDALNSPDRTIDGDGVTIPQMTAARLRARGQDHLNAAQRSVLASTLSKPMTEKENERLVDRHVRALADYRLTMIARQEATRTLNAGEYLAFRQGRANRSIPRTARRFWMTQGDERVRHDHRMVPGMNAEGVDVGEPFQTPLGSVMYPPLEANCRCRVGVRWPEAMTLALAA